MESVQELLQHALQSWTVYTFAALSVAIIFFAYQEWTKSTPKVAIQVPGRPTILFVGPMGSGKTSLFGRLAYRICPPTHTSMIASTAPITGNLRLVDIPGHPRLRSNILSQYLPSANGVVFFVDPAINANASGIQATAEHLHIVLSLIRILESKIGKSLPLLILLTKSDTWTAAQKGRAQDRVRTALEREMEKRKTASSGVATNQARLESIDELPSGTTSSGLSSLIDFVWRTTPKPLVAPNPRGINLPSDEQEILQSDVLDFEGPFSWEEASLGVSVRWASASAKGSASPTLSEALPETDKTDLKPNGDTDGLYEWIDTCVR